ncbi:hypothetical protein F5148DRAFT_1243688 [Russula earlei]|uniref:Uncharacterized protein n=1 Tax=Russula earlei TaxID=71964 RepID=A0ACC0TWL6_9AGAM|nr:hypothetical protein F5148DRAFT_1243688 [Russula earlei]
MVDYHNPMQILLDNLALLKVWHAVDALFLWEFTTSLYFEWNVFRGPKPYKPTIWIYSLTRLAALVAVIVNLVLLNMASQINCEVSVMFEMVPAYLALSAASLLMVLRTIGIWKQNRVVVAIACSTWAISGVFIIQGIARLKYVRVASWAVCKPLNVQDTKLTMVVTFVTDVILVVIMLVGLSRDGCYRRRAFGLGRLLWDQGMVFLCLSTIAGVLPTVFLFLDLNEPLSIIFHVPWLVTMSIAATRMYRKLEIFLSPDGTCSPPTRHCCLHGTGHESSRTMSIAETSGTIAMPDPPNRIGVEMYATPQAAPDVAETTPPLLVPQRGPTMA